MTEPKKTLEERNKLREFSGDLPDYLYNAIPPDFFAGLSEADSGQCVDLDTALTKEPPTEPPNPQKERMTE